MTPVILRMKKPSKVEQTRLRAGQARGRAPHQDHPAGGESAQAGQRPDPTSGHQPARRAGATCGRVMHELNRANLR